MTFKSFSVDAVNRAASVQEYASGKAGNVARVLHTLGHDVVWSGFLGGDSGTFYRHDLDRAGVHHDFVEVEPSTRLCITIVDEASGTATELVEESRPIAAQDYQALLEKVRQLLGRAELMVLSGTLTPGAPANFYARCIELASPRVRVILDAVGQPLLEALPRRPFAIKPNRTEIARTLGATIDSDESLREGMKALAQRGAQWVIATRGKQGTLVTDGKAFWQVSTAAVSAINPIGSGDSFAAGLAAGLVRGNDVPHACVLGSACGSANAMTLLAGHLRTEDVESLARQITLQEFR